jgi:molybdopterin synthase sulfur carrier subunit
MWIVQGSSGTLNRSLPPAPSAESAMTVTVLYFAALREALGTDRETLSLSPEIRTVGHLRASLCSRGGVWEALKEGRSLRAAVNQRLAAPDAALRDGDEVAFFPPVTGG